MQRHGDPRGVASLDDTSDRRVKFGMRAVHAKPKPQTKVDRPNVQAARPGTRAISSTVSRRRRSSIIANIAGRTSDTSAGSGDDRRPYR
jgi:hypothetical protein